MEPVAVQRPQQAGATTIRRRKEETRDIDHGERGYALKKQKKKKQRGSVGPCTCIAFVLMMIVVVLFGPRGFRHMKSKLAKEHVDGWLTDVDLLARSEELRHEAPLDKKSCQLPAYPDSTQVPPSREDFHRRYWVDSRVSAVMIELGTFSWAYRGSMASKAALQQAVMEAGEWTLHFAHSNKTAMDHHIHLERVFNPEDKFNAPWAEITVAASPGDVPAHFFPVPASEPWAAWIVPALSGQSPTIAKDTMYLVVLSGQIRVLVYRSSHSFHIPDAHTYDWHNEGHSLVRQSGNPGKMCLVSTDQALLVPSGFGYAFLAIDNSVILKIKVQRGY